MAVIFEELEKPAPPEGLISHCEGLTEKVCVMTEIIAGSRCFGIVSYSFTSRHIVVCGVPESDIIKTMTKY